MSSIDQSRDLDTHLIHKGRQSSFTYTRSFHQETPGFLQSETVFGRLERAFPEKIGFYYLLCSILFMSLNAYFTQTASELPVQEIIFLRSLFMMIGVYIFISKYNSDLDVGDKKYKKIVLILALIGFPTAFSYVYGVLSLQLVDAITIMISSPIFVSIFSWFIFAQHFKKEQLISIVLWLIGITLVMRSDNYALSSESPTDDSLAPSTQQDVNNEIAVIQQTYHFRGIVACLINALLTASSSIVVKATNVKVPPIMLMTYGTLINLVFSGVLCLIGGFTIPSTEAWINMIGIGFLFFYGQFFLMKSLDRASEGVNAPLINNIQIVLIYIIQVAFVQITPSFVSFLGTVLVVAGCVVLAALSQ